MSPKTVWEFECLNCGYRLAEVMVNQARFDYGCPKCGHSFEQLTYRKRRMGKMEAEMSYLLEEKTRKLENAEMLIERLKREVKELNFSVALHDRYVEKARAIWKEAHPDKAPEWLCREDLMVWLMDRVERAEAVKDSLRSALVEISEFSAYWQCFRGNEEALGNVWNIDTDALIFLRTTEDSSVVGLIDGTHAKQQEDSANTDGDGDILNDIETSLRAKTDGMKRLLESQTLSPELASIGRELVRLAEKSLGEVTE